MLKLELSSEEALKLEMYLRLTTKYREGEATAYESLFEEMKASESPDEKALTNLKNNAEYWKKQCVIMNELQERISTLLTTPSTQTSGGE